MSTYEPANEPPSVAIKRRFRAQRIITLALFALTVPTADAYPMEDNLDMDMEVEEQQPVSLDEFVMVHLQAMFANASEEYGELEDSTLINSVVNGLRELYPDIPHPLPPHDCGPHDKNLDPINATYDEVPYPGEEVGDEDDVSRESLIYACIQQSLVYPIDSAAAQVGKTMTDNDKNWLRRSFGKMCSVLPNRKIPHPLDESQDGEEPIEDQLTIESFANCSLRDNDDDDDDDGDIEQDFVNKVRSTTTICKLFGL